MKLMIGLPVVFISICLPAMNAICEYYNCLNGGICSGWPGDKFCDCQEEFNGELCQYQPCSEESCLNGGDCHADHGATSPDSYSCTCYGNYHGHDCEYESNDDDGTELGIAVIIAIVMGGVVVVILLLTVVCICYHKPSGKTSTVVAPDPTSYTIPAQYNTDYCMTTHNDFISGTYQEHYY
ncbi:uncharacterized protein [Antedon mediterranea]|uniref:uncharacterized protein n=1 Tax=Antedon mediterranea TaxID=105859 RepID=UPI003AF52A81